MPKEEQKAGPDYSKYEKITDKLIEGPTKQTQGLEDALTLAWAKQVEASKDNHGKEFGGKAYQSLVDFVEKDIYGITQKPEGNEDYAEVQKKILDSALGFTQSDLDRAYNGKKVIHVGDLRAFVEKGQKTLIDNLRGIQVGKLTELSDEDKKSFKAYVKDLAGKVGSKISDESMPTHELTIKTYLSLVEILRQKKRSEEMASKYKGPLEAANNLDFEEEAAA